MKKKYLAVGALCVVILIFLIHLVINVFFPVPLGSRSMEFASDVGAIFGDCSLSPDGEFKCKILDRWARLHDETTTIQKVVVQNINNPAVCEANFYQPHREYLENYCGPEPCEQQVIDLEATGCVGTKTKEGKEYRIHILMNYTVLSDNGPEPRFEQGDIYGHYRQGTRMN
jgi:hypothetical protein